MWNAKISHRQLGLMALLFLIFSIAAFLGLWLADSKEFKEQKLSELQNISTIAAHHIAISSKLLLQNIEDEPHASPPLQESSQGATRELLADLWHIEKALNILGAAAELQVEIGLAVENRLERSSIKEMNEALEIPSGDSLRIGAEQYYFARASVLLESASFQHLAVVVLSPRAELQHLVQSRAFSRLPLILFGFGASVLIIFLLTERTITAPLLALEKSANEFSQGNLNPGVESDRHDEFGRLARAVLNMRDVMRFQIQDLNALNQKVESQNEELRKHRSHLEELVMSRTIELSQTNTRLQQEISERKEAETALRTSHLTMEQRVRELGTLNHITQILVSTLDLHMMLNRISLELMDIFQASSSGIALLSADKKHLVIFDDYALLDTTPSTRGASIPVEEYQAFQQLQHSPKPLIIQDAQHNPLTAPGHELVRKRGIHNMMIVPLISRGEILGTIGIDSDQAERIFTEDDAMLAETIAGHIAAAIEHAHLFQNEQQHRRVAESLREVSSVLNRSLDLDTVISKILEQLQRVLSYDSAGVLLREGNELVVYAGAGIADSTIGNRISLAGENPGARVFNSRQSLVIQDVQKDRHWASWPEGSSTHGWIGAPLLLGNSALGILTIDSFQADTYDRQDAEILQAFANQAVIAIENARLFSREQRQREIAESLQATTTAVNSSLEHGIVLAKILEQLQRVIQYDAAAIFLQEEDKLVLSDGRFIDQNFLGRGFPISGNSPEAQVFTQKKPKIINDVTQDADWGDWEGDRIRSWIGVPLFIGEQVIGILTIDNFSPSAYDEEDAALLQGFANQVSISIHNAQLYQDIRRENKFFEILMANSPVATILVDLENRVQSWNPAAERLFGYTQAEAGQQNIDRLIAKHGIQEEAAEYSQRLRHGKPLRAITRRNRKDGRFVDVELLAVPMRVEDRIVSFLALYHDISELQQAREEAESANRAKSVFLANMSHELRTPLTAILGFSELLSQSPSFPAEEQSYLHTIYRNGEHLLMLLNNLLDLARLETGDITIEERNFNLYRLLDELKYLLSSRIDTRQIRLSFHCAPEVPQFVRTDEIKLHQVLLNVLTDILKFTTEGQVVLKIGFREQKSMHNASQQPHLLFEIGSSSELTKGDVEEFLPVSRQFVRLIGGEVNISKGFDTNGGREARHGLLFSFAVPVGIVPSPELRVRSENHPHAQAGFSGSRYTKAEFDDLPSEDFSTLPLEVLDQLEYAVITADIARVKTLLNEISSYDPGLTDTLTGLVESFEYAQILKALHSIKTQV